MGKREPAVKMPVCVQKNENCFNDFMMLMVKEEKEEITTHTFQ